MKNKKDQRHFYKKVVKIPIYFGNFVIIFSNNEEKIRETTHFKGNLEEFAFTFHNFLCRGSEAIAVCFNFWTSEQITMGTIIHEINHAGNRLLLSRNIDPNYDNDESESYVKGWMADEVEKFMIECNLSSRPTKQILKAKLKPQLQI
jgi:hypothetical protein